MSRFDLFEPIIKDLSIKNTKSIFVEIGTDKGDFAEFLLTKSSCSKLICIDPYLKYEGYIDAMNERTGDVLFDQTKSRFAKYENRIVFIRKFSYSASNEVTDQVDFVYVDGNHSYKYVFQDLLTWYPKIKSGGILAGDDIYDFDDSLRNKEGDVHIEWGPGNYGDYGVLKALRDFKQITGVDYEIFKNQFIIRKI